MRLSQYNFDSRREAPRDADSANATLLTRGRFIERSMAGVYNFLPLGWMVIEKITSVVRRHLNATGALEARFVTLQDKELWQVTGRWETAKAVMYQFRDPSEREIGLGFTHEEVFVDLLSRQPLSYSDFPFKLYQIQTKFRFEPRPKSGLLRGREFLMKDLYSAHADQSDYRAYYDLIRQTYKEIFDHLSLPTVETLASGGVFTDNYSHEFQVLAPVGEDEIYLCEGCAVAVNGEIMPQINRVCPRCQTSDLKAKKAIEVGNTFDLGTYYSQKMGVLFTDHQGQAKPFWMASYGLGISRTMGAIVERHHDERGICWPAAVAPFLVHLVGLRQEAEAVYRQLSAEEVTVLFDDRSASPGEKLAEADLLGMPVRLTVGERTGEGEVEWKERAKEASEVVSMSEAVGRLKAMA